MVPLFVGYALIVWFFAGKHRRRLVGALAVVLGLLGLIALNYLHIKLGEWTNGDIFVPVMQSLTYPYTLLVVMVGGFIWAIPREQADRCARCGYSLEGLEPPVGSPVGTAGGFLVCPECGFRHATRESYRRSGADREHFQGTDDRANTHPRFIEPRRRARGASGFEHGPEHGPEQEAPIVVRAPSAPGRPPEPAHGEDREGQPADERPPEREEPLL